MKEEMAWEKYLKALYGEEFDPTKIEITPEE